MKRFDIFINLSAEDDVSINDIQDIALKIDTKDIGIKVTDFTVSQVISTYHDSKEKNSELN